MYGSNITDSYGMIYTTKKKFKFRSPSIYDDDYEDRAHYVLLGGDVSIDYGWNVNDSYGRKLSGS